jgi:hypothetical protein
VFLVLGAGYPKLVAPLTIITSPETYRDASLMSMQPASATSVAEAMRPNGELSIWSFRVSCE